MGTCGRGKHTDDMPHRHHQPLYTHIYNDIHDYTHDDCFTIGTMLQGAAGQHATGTGAKLQQPADNRSTEGAQDGSIEMSKAAQRK